MNEIKKGAWLTLGSPLISELSAHYPYDWALLDMEHGFFTEEGLLQSLQAMKFSGITVVVRVGKLDPLLISKALDYGASAIMLPHASTLETVSQCYSYMNYPPDGNRGFSSSVRSLNFGVDYLNIKRNNTKTLLFAQIETQLALDNLEEIAGFHGVDILFVGPADLKLSLQSYYSGYTDHLFTDALYKVIDVAKRNGKKTGILSRSSADLQTYYGLGFDYIAYGSDLAYLRTGFAKAFKDLEDL